MTDETREAVRATVRDCAAMAEFVGLRAMLNPSMTARETAKQIVEAIRRKWSMAFEEREREVGPENPPGSIE